ncbi:hypothetical protein GWK47_037642 [Chionoecetes opilio]|uniref:Uncharacterized protein n=1 Tax=Chionoecetes opilio TaxID=41210 RepID=A0A8J4YLN7_CHIOP|nr:hypothetical protein GWK47_037642 [Chionoecetes opilio]
MAGVIAEGSVDQALRGKHYNRSIRCLRLMYEALMRRLILYSLCYGASVPEDVKCQLMQIYDNSKYGRWMVEYWLELSNLPEERTAYMRDGLFSQSITGKPYSCLPLDLWIEMTMIEDESWLA